MVHHRGARLRLRPLDVLELGAWVASVGLRRRGSGYRSGCPRPLDVLELGELLQSEASSRSRAGGTRDSAECGLAAAAAGNVLLQPGHLNSCHRLPAAPSSLQLYCLFVVQAHNPLPAHFSGQVMVQTAFDGALQPVKAAGQYVQRAANDVGRGAANLAADVAAAPPIKAAGQFMQRAASNVGRGAANLAAAVPMPHMERWGSLDWRLRRRSALPMRKQSSAPDMTAAAAEAAAEAAAAKGLADEAASEEAAGPLPGAAAAAPAAKSAAAAAAAALAGRPAAGAAGAGGGGGRGRGGGKGRGAMEGPLASPEWDQEEDYRMVADLPLNSHWIKVRALACPAPAPAWLAPGWPSKRGEARARCRSGWWQRRGAM